ncbi:S1 RNA-binding domain-containing protein [Candidatus Pacearchaeota archaeon]|nr:S1 RNA-binding domain-containing protein [Candidatus Pacearchaeota archaeon]
MKIKEDDIVLCTVKKIEGTAVFVEIEGGHYGSIVFSEIAAGRIRNIRDYVSVGRLIVCKILKIAPDHIELSFRRITAKERDMALDRHKKEAALKSLLKAIGEEPARIIDNIKDSYDVGDFFEEIKSNPKLFEKFLSKEKAEKISKMLSEKVEKEKFVKKKFVLKSLSEHGVRDIKEILNFENVDIKYLGSSTFSASSSGRDFKEAEGSLARILEEIEKKAKEKRAFFEIVKEK